jgi:hypothetical protein
MGSEWGGVRVTGSSTSSRICPLPLRYGFIDEESGKSMTHLEYDEAQRLALPTLIYLIDEQNQPVLPKFVDTGDEAKLLQGLKHELKRKYVVSCFTTPDELAKRITQDLPPILGQIGVKIEPEPEEVIHADAKEILERFRVRPARYAGREITLRCRGAFGMRVIFPVGHVSGKVCPTGQQTPILKPFKNKRLHFSPANPFLDTRRMISHLRLQLVIGNEVSQSFIIRTLVDHIHRCRELSHASRTDPEYAIDSRLSRFA